MNTELDIRESKNKGGVHNENETGGAGTPPSNRLGESYE